MHSAKFVLAAVIAIAVLGTAQASQDHRQEPTTNEFPATLKKKPHECEGMRILREKLELAHQVNEKLRAQLRSLSGKLFNIPEYSDESTEDAFSPMINSTFATCEEAMQANQGTDGVYRLYLPKSGMQAFNVYCLRDHKNGTAWTLFQRRFNGSENFFRNWTDYKNGFGNLSNEFWLGLDKLHALTDSQQHELWIRVSDFDGNHGDAIYKDFFIGDEASKYTLIRLGWYEGDAGDSLSYHRGQMFSTYDQDHDSSAKNCAEAYSGAWWYNACHLSNLNGLYLSGEYSCDKYGKGMVWQSFRDFLYSLKYTHMAIRPVRKY